MPKRSADQNSRNGLLLSIQRAEISLRVTVWTAVVDETVNTRFAIVKIRCKSQQGRSSERNRPIDVVARVVLACLLLACGWNRKALKSSDPAKNGRTNRYTTRVPRSSHIQLKPPMAPFPCSWEMAAPHTTCANSYFSYPYSLVSLQI